MNLPKLVLRVYTVSSTALILFGCSPGESQLITSALQNDALPRSKQGPLGFSTTAAYAARAGNGKFGDGESWMAPEAKSEDLLYISNSYTVTVYSYPSGKHVGTLRHFFRPLGECVDQTGDVFIANGTGQVFEYSHGGTKRIATLTMSGYQPQSCAVDPTTGNLAVTWDDGFSQGYLAVYQHATGTPTLYSNGNMVFAFCGYDGSGNLYADGQYGETAYSFAFAELPKDAQGLESITLDQSFQHEGPVQWDGKYMTVGDNAAQKIYRFTIAGSSGTLQGTVSLGDGQYMTQWWIFDKKVIGSRAIEPDVTWYWKYPAGGMPIKTLTLKGIGAPAGVTVSRLKRKKAPGSHG